MSRPPLALIVDDHEWSVRSLESILAPKGYVILRAFTGKRAVELARAAAPDLLIIDANLPDGSGTDVCRTLRSDPRIGAATPIIIKTSGPWGRTQRLDALAAGAWDFVGLPLDAEAFLLKLDAYVRGKIECDRAWEESLVDPATGLYNLRGLQRRALELGSEASRHHWALACVAFGPERAKERSAAEDGAEAEADHATAPIVVERLMHILKDSGRASDAMGRVSASEFAVIAPGANATGALRLAQRLTEAADQAFPARLRAGYYAVPDFHDAGIRPTALLERATMALRSSRTEPDGDQIRRYNDSADPSQPPTI